MMNLWQAIDEAGLHGAIYSKETGCTYEVNRMAIDQNQKGSWIEGWTVVRDGPKQPEPTAQPYKTPFQTDEMRNIVSHDGRHIVFDDDRVARLNATVDAAREEGRREMVAERDAARGELARLKSTVKHTIDLAIEEGRREGLPPVERELLEAYKKMWHLADSDAVTVAISERCMKAGRAYRDSLQPDTPDEPAANPCGVACECRERIAKLDRLLRLARRYVVPQLLQEEIDDALAESGRQP